MTDGHGVDVALDPVGGPRLGQLLRSVRPHGTVVALGFIAGTEPVFDVVDLIVGEKHLVGYSLHADDDNDIAEALQAVATLAADGHLRPAIDSRFALDDFEAGYARLASRESIGSVIVEL